MRLLILAPRLPAAPWSIAPIVAAITRSLVARGHSITLLADSIEDPDQFPDAALHAFREFSQTSTDFPIGFRRWAWDRAAVVPHDSSLSFTRRAFASVTLPLDPTPRAWLAHHLRSKSPLALAAHLAKHHSVVLALGAGALRARDARRRTLCTVGPQAHQHAARALGLPAEYPFLVDLRRFSLLAPANDAERESARRSLRGSLGIPHDRVLLVLSAPDSFGRALGPLFGAVESLAQRQPHSAPFVLALTRDTFSLLRAASCRQGTSSRPPPWLRILTPTHDIRPALLAADYALAPFAAPINNHAHAAARGRFLTDALWLGTPVLALQSAPGADLITPTAARAPAPGLIVPRNTHDAWLDTLTRAIQPEVLIESRAAVDRAAITLGFSEAFATIESTLAKCAQGCLAPPPRWERGLGGGFTARRKHSSAKR